MSQVSTSPNPVLAITLVKPDLITSSRVSPLTVQRPFERSDRSLRALLLLAGSGARTWRRAREPGIEVRVWAGDGLSSTTLNCMILFGLSKSRLLSLLG